MPMLFGDHGSQPTRACLIFSRINKLPVEEKIVRVMHGDHLKPPYSEMYPLKKIPLLKDDDVILPESATIMRYLASKFNVPDNWYPGQANDGVLHFSYKRVAHLQALSDGASCGDLKARARVDAAMDWHHGNLRRGVAGLMFQKVLAPLRGLASVKELIADHLKTVTSSLKAMETYWLGKSNFVGGDQISIADLLLATELEQLEYLDASDGPYMSEILAPYPGVRAWLARVRETVGPVYDDVHQVMHKAVSRLKQAARQSKL